MSTSSRDCYATFNKAMLDFMRDLSTSFPVVEGFRRVYASTNLMATLRPTMIQAIFAKHVATPFSDKIIARDETFFMAKDYTNDVAVVGESAEFVSMIKTIWVSLSQDDKDNIWKHMALLVTLNHMIETGGAQDCAHAYVAP